MNFLIKNYRFLKNSNSSSDSLRYNGIYIKWNNKGKGIFLAGNRLFRLLLIESKGGKTFHFAKELIQHGFVVSQVESGREGISFIEANSLPDVLIINAASLRTNGTRMCETFRRLLPNVPILLIVAKDSKLTDLSCASFVLNLPFTVRKLINRIEPYKFSEDKELFCLGPLVLNLQTHFLTCNGRETQLTPRLFNLLKYMMERPGQILEREKLFKEVWDTNYLGDTRTLDVHISWLRLAIEESSRNPKIIRTIRAHGYKLDLN